MASPELVAKANKALRGSVKLSNEILGTMNLLDMGIPITPGIVAAMRRYIADVEAYVSAIERPVRVDHQKPIKPAPRG